jgi:hypothetical protein
MNIAGAILALYFLGAVLTGVVLIIVACVQRRWKMAVGTGIGLVVVVCVVAGLLTQGSPYLHSPVTSESIDGTYRVNSEPRLRRMGYSNFAGEVTLNPEGNFTATNIPACYIHGRDETIYPFSGGYYTLSGTWRVNKVSDDYVVQLHLSTAQISGQPAEQARAVFRESRTAPQTLDVHLMKGRPLALGFSIFNGDFDDILFTKDKK